MLFECEENVHRNIDRYVPGTFTSTPKESSRGETALHRTHTKALETPNAPEWSDHVDITRGLVLPKKSIKRIVKPQIIALSKLEKLLHQHDIFCDRKINYRNFVDIIATILDQVYWETDDS
jgi:hypothetical protein